MVPAVTVTVVLVAGELAKLPLRLQKDPPTATFSPASRRCRPLLQPRPPHLLRQPPATSHCRGLDGQRGLSALGRGFRQ